MIHPSLSSLRASAALVFALALTGCFSSHPCPEVKESILVEGHLDYAFKDGTQTSVDITPDDPTTRASAAQETMNVAWDAPLPGSAGDVAVLLLSMKLPDADGSFDLGTLSAEVCACQSSYISQSETETKCVTGPAMTPAECQPATGHLEIHHMESGICGTKAVCPDVTVELVLTSPAEKGLSGSFTFRHIRTVVNATCVDSFVDIG
jgi:hypothetical protein